MNPYAAPLVESVATETDPRNVRLRHLKIEARIRGLGLLQITGGALVIALMLPLLAMGIGSDEVAAFVVFGVVLAVASIAVGSALFDLKPWARVAETVVLCLGAVASGLLALPLAIYALRILWQRELAIVFSAHYRTEVIPETLDLKPGTSVVFWLLLALAGAAIMLVVGFAMAVAWVVWKG